MNQSSEKNPPNRLAKESSPYLQQHQYNPVDWYPWGFEAFEAARRLNRPIFLSVGYSTCYWCHVMERQCFEDPAIAEVMNDLFINIKVDREERPDVDSLYMTAVQVLTQHGGWPMSVFLMPDLRPFHGGTYFPPQDMHGRPGLVTVLRSIENAFRNRPGDVEKSASQLINVLGNLAQPPVPKQPVRIDLDFVEAQIKESIYDYDAMHGGFGGAPKFPRQTLLQLMLVHQRHFPDEQRMKIIRHTLDAMANGGIRDHLGGAFHRYSTDRQWLVPHFEIMLYDNAMLAWCYTEAFNQTGEARYADVTRRILDFALREMTSPQGAFYTAIDAEVDAQEGLNYLWTKDEVESVLGAEASPVFRKLYGLDEGPNFVDPHHGNGVANQNILFLKNAEGENDPGIVTSREKLYQHRASRKQPLLDTKVLTSWNGLMIRAFAYAGRVLKETRYVEAATRAAKYILKSHRMTPSPSTLGEGGGEGLFALESDLSSRRAGPLPSPLPGYRERESDVQSSQVTVALARTSRDGVAKCFGFLDDYAFLAQACLAIADATDDQSWRDEASNLATEIKYRFGDAESGGCFFTDKAAIDLPVRQKIASDSPLPSGNAVAADVLQQLGDGESTRRILAAFAQNLASQGAGMSSMLEAALLHVQTEGPFTVSSASAKPTELPAQLAANVVGIQSSWRDSKTIIVDVHILDGFHLHANPASDRFLATELFLYDEMTAKIDYPPGTNRTFTFADQPIRVYEGHVQLIVHLAQPITGSGVVPMVLRYQACDDSSCLSPVSKKFEVKAP